MLILALAALASAASAEPVLIPGSTVYFDLEVIAPAGAARGFRIGRTEVTWDEYNLYADSFRDEPVDGITRPSQPDVVNPRDPFPDGTVQTGRYPARSIGRYGALGYCAWLSRKTGRRFRLPTEPEWIAAAGAGTADGWHAGNSEGRTHPVGQQAPNVRGLHDISGNVAEWCLESWSRTGGAGVVRGGSLRTPANRLGPRLRERVDLEAWLADDPKRPVRDWWFTDAPFVGFRIVEPDPDGRTTADRDAAIGRIVISDVTIADPGAAPVWMARVTGRLACPTGDPLDEVELDGCFTDAAGHPIRTDPRGKPAYGRAWPVLDATAHRDGRQRPLTARTSRPFTIEIPRPFDEVGALPAGLPIVRVTWVRFAR